MTFWFDWLCLQLGSCPVLYMYLQVSRLTFACDLIAEKFFTSLHIYR